MAATAPIDTSPSPKRPLNLVPAPLRQDPKGGINRVESRPLRTRRLRIIAYFVHVAIHFTWWDYILKRSALRAFRTPWVPRWHRLTERYKQLALELQGVWIKLGQYLSTRVDVLPLEITRELASLRDEVPAEPTTVIVAQIEAECGCLLEDIFPWFSRSPIGSASLAQVHQARTVAGESVVVKVLRPAIREVIRADIRLIRQLARWLKWLKPIATRANIDAIVNEFDTVTSNELDLRLEARNAERFAQDFANDPGVAVPRIYHNQSSSSMLTMEDVSYIRIDDIGSMEVVGIDPAAVARKVYNVYLQQFFLTYRIHCDPHAGNLFIRPLPTPQEIATHPNRFRRGEFIPYAANRPFQLVIVDFGMFVELPQRLREGLREFVIGLGTRDARRILHSYTKVGVLQSGADLYRLEEMIQYQLDELWGTFLGQVRARDLTSAAAEAFFEKYEELISATPLQFQTEMLFVVRAMGILSGITSHLDPKFDPATETAAFAQVLIQEDILKVVRSAAQDVVSGRLPSAIGSLLGLLPQPRPIPPQPPGVDARRSAEIRRLRRTVNRLTALVVASGMLTVGVVLKVRGVRVENAVAFLWPGNDLGQWLIELSGIAIFIMLLRRGSNE